MLVAHFYLLALSSAQRVLVQAVSISINVVLKVCCCFFFNLNIRTSDRSVIIIIIIIITAVTNTQGIWLILPKCIPLQS